MNVFQVISRGSVLAALAVLAAGQSALAESDQEVLRRIAELEQTIGSQNEIIKQQQKEMRALRDTVTVIESQGQREAPSEWEAAEGAQPEETEAQFEAEAGFVPMHKRALYGLPAALDFHPYIGGFVTLDLLVPTSDEASPSHFTYDTHHADLIFGVNYRDRLNAEFLLEYEHSGEDDKVRLLAGFLDWKVFGEDYLTLRAGSFLMPVGMWNDTFWPDYLNPIIQRPYYQRELIPVKWSEQGMMAYGSVDLGPVNLHYDLFLVNGLSVDDAGEALGLSPRKYRGVSRDFFDADKAYGGRLTFSRDDGILKGGTLGVSGYRGAYDIEGHDYINFIGAHFSYVREGLRVLGEYTSLIQDDATEQEHKWGYYVVGGYRLGALGLDQFEAVLMHDAISPREGPEKKRFRVTGGLNYYPLKSTDAFVIKANYAHTENKGHDLDDDVFGLELTVGF